MDLITHKNRPAGYEFLMKHFGLMGMPHWRKSFVSTSGTYRSIVQDGAVEDTYPIRYWPGEKPCDHLEFALKYDGVNLGLLFIIFEHLSQIELTEYIKSKPTGKYTRRIWFFYEFLTGSRLTIDDLTVGNYIDALETVKYFTIQNGKKSQRHRVVNNLCGPRTFCPIIRKTEKLTELAAMDIRKQCEDIVNAYAPELLRRALTYFYKKETKSSFAIENIKPSASRTEKFMASLVLADKEDFCDKERLIELQNRIVDPRFNADDYRRSQNYVGQSAAWQKEIIHYICPRPDDIHELMSGLLESHKLMKAGNVSPVVHAAAISYGFVFLHPFEDGNGRIHRFLIHNILSLSGLVQHGLIFPISAVILKNSADYDASLEAFSRPLLQLIDYRMDEMGQMTIENDTACWYKYMDLTMQTESLFSFIIKTIEDELVTELSYLANYDTTKRAIQDIIDMPDRLIDLFIQLCLQNSGRLSVKKRSAYFNFLTDEEVAAMEQAVLIGYSQEKS
ncbi:MAG: Fic family protein [Bacillota bacterium]|nr:Fic family protein [Bacillota bacterium]